MTLKETYQAAKDKGRDEIRRFMRDMRRAGLRMRHYRGRYFWEGPAVSTDSLQEVLSATKVKCQWDSLGLGYIVYPRQSL